MREQPRIEQKVGDELVDGVSWPVVLVVEHVGRQWQLMRCVSNQRTAAAEPRRTRREVIADLLEVLVAEIERDLVRAGLQEQKVKAFWVFGQPRFWIEFVDMDARVLFPTAQRVVAELHRGATPKQLQELLIEADCW
jgi:hypothetical protein